MILDRGGNIEEENYIRSRESGCQNDTRVIKDYWKIYKETDKHGDILPVDEHRAETIGLTKAQSGSYTNNRQTKPETDS